MPPSAVSAPPPAPLIPPSAPPAWPFDAGGPTFPWLAAGFLLAGLGTVLLGPLLPTLSATWRLSDADGGGLLLVKFLGAFLGGVAVPRRLRRGVLTGSLLCALGFGTFAFCRSFLPGALALFVSGLGLGQLIASTDILAGRRFRVHTGSRLALLNFFWSLGAVLTGLLAAGVLPSGREGSATVLRAPMLGLAALFLLTGAGGLLQTFRPPREPAWPGKPSAPPQEPEAASRWAPRVLFRFSLLLLLYGGLETCLTAWLTTYAVRFASAAPLHGQVAVVLLWSALTVGRLLSSALLRVRGERTVQRLGLLLAVAAILGLMSASGAGLLSLASVALGFGLAPWFPCTFAMLMPFHPPARAAGFILAVSGIGAALFPWLMGVLSAHLGSLRLAMAIPAALAAGLLLLSWVPLPGGDRSPA